MSLRGWFAGPLTLVLACSAGASKGAPVVQAPVDMIDGRWESRPASPGDAEPTLNSSSMTLDLWQAPGDSIAGRLVHWVGGDLPIDTRRFGPITGAVAGGRVVLRLPQPGPAGAITIEATRQGDTLVVNRSTIDGDDGPFGSAMRLVRSGPAVKT